MLFFIYINDLSDDITTNVKLFVDETSPFSVVHNMNTSTTNLNNDLNKIKNWAIQWKMNVNPGPSKRAQEVIFSRKLQKANHNQVYFNHNSVKQVPRQPLVTVYKAFIRPHVDYGEITTKLIINPFIKKWSQYNVALHLL